MVKRWMGSKPVTCDLCRKSMAEKKFFVDGKTKFGPWGCMCPSCFKSMGVGLGLSCGQKYDMVTLEKMEG